MEKEIRLDKLLAEEGFGTRSEVRGIIKCGTVTVGGMIIKDCGYKVRPTADTVLVGKTPVLHEASVYYMLNKPQGYVSATKDNLNETVFALLRDKGIVTKQLFPVGRLDKDTEGLLLLTNDGALTHELLSPRKHVKKTYLAVLDGALKPDDIHALESGIEIGDEKPCLPAIVKKSDQIDTDAYEITIMEGRYHQVKRMFAKRGRDVLYLKRLSMGGLQLDEMLQPGEFRRLTAEELLRLRNNNDQ